MLFEFSESISASSSRLILLRILQGGLQYRPSPHYFCLLVDCS